MADSTPSWLDVLSVVLQSPEKGALFLVLLAGAWRWIRELWRESKEDTHHETLVESLMRQIKDLQVENKALREELRKERES